MGVHQTRIDDWKKAIVQLAFVHQHLRDADRKGLWSPALPNVAATEQALVDAERHMGSALDPDYRRFLGYANGWDRFFQDIDLFGTADLISGARHDEAQARLRIFADEQVFTLSGLNQDDLLPIAVTMLDRDLFVLVTAGPNKGQVRWFAGEEIDCFENVDAFFLAMTDHNRRAVKRLLDAAPKH